MPYQIQWFVEKRVILAHVYGEVIEADGIDLNKTIIKMIEDGTAPLFLVIHTLDIHRVPLGLLPIVQGLNNSELGTNKEGWMIVVSNNRLHSFFGTVAAKIMGVRIMVVPTLEDAEAFIRTQARDIAEYMPALQVG